MNEWRVIEQYHDINEFFVAVFSIFDSSSVGRQEKFSELHLNFNDRSIVGNDANEFVLQSAMT